MGLILEPIGTDVEVTRYKISKNKNYKFQVNTNSEPSRQIQSY